jgi:sarcosine oxidase subunit gamma
VVETCLVTRRRPLALLDVTARPAAWSGGLTALETVVALTPERRILQAGDAAAMAGSLDAVAAQGGRGVDVSHAWQPIAIDGPAARSLLERGIDLDLAPDHFPPGHGVATLCARVPVLLRAEAGGGYTLLVATSYADWLMLWLQAARAAVAPPHPPDLPAG